MYIEPIKAEVVLSPVTEKPRGNLFVGLVLMAVVIPWIILRLLAHFIAKDAGLVTRAARALAQEMRNARTKRT